MALSCVRQMQNLHLIAFDEEAIKVSAKCLQEINRLRETYRPDLPQYSVPREKGTAQNRKRKVSGSWTNLSLARKLRPVGTPRELT